MNDDAMKLIILAAGVGSRLWPMTKHVPKSLIDLGDGRCLLERQIENAAACDGIDEVVVVSGYRAQQLEARIRQLKAPVTVRTVFNPVYRITNNLLSVWMARQEMVDRDFVLSNGDNLYHDEVLPQLAGSGDGIWLTIDRKQAYDDDDMKVLLDGETVARVSKEIAAEEADAESVGLVMVRGERFRNIFLQTLDELVREEESLGAFWLELFNVMARNGVLVRTVEIAADDWVEVDFHPDIRRIRNAIEAKIKWAD